eukprot:6770865-Prymnesium_polylepis.1
MAPVVEASRRMLRSHSTEFFNGDLDDLGFFGGVLSDSDVKARWNVSLSDRIKRGVEPDLVLFWNFDSAHLGRIPNVGTAGSDYDLVLGRLGRAPGYGGSSNFYDAETQRNRVFVPPNIVPAWGSPKVPDEDAPFVTIAAAGST